MKENKLLTEKETASMLGERLHVASTSSKEHGNSVC